MTGRPVRAVVVFSDRTEIWLLRLLRRGFRHCFVLLDFGHCWVVVEPLSHCTMIDVLPPASADHILAWYSSRGMVAVCVERRAVPWRIAPVRPYSCVESVKRILGIQAGWVLTPWQLFKLFSENRKKDVAQGNKTGL